MQKLAKREAQLMDAVWQLERAFVREIIALLPDNPHYNTVSTMVKILVEKGFLGQEKLGNAYRYYALISRAAYQSEHKAAAADEVVNSFFDGSPRKLVSYFAREKQLSPEELEEILDMIKRGEE
ncbi:MAG: BlaI/MecI/CopY family transcriptional regulator [Bacteroidota bacterium]